MKQGILQCLLADRAAKHAVALATDTGTGNQTLVYQNSAKGPDSEDIKVLALARQSIQDDRSRMHLVGDRQIFIQTFNPPLRMLIVGAVHIAQPLSRIASV
ncbi:MAG: xanthine dehydrogenase, partial [Pseudomonadota bacterium]|nr:xanthine dehydrogenase [Pseudomonadota bacterium]